MAGNKKPKSLKNKNQEKKYCVLNYCVALIEMEKEKNSVYRLLAKQIKTYLLSVMLSM